MRILIALLIAVVAAPFSAATRTARGANFLPVGAELDRWSDMAFAAGVSGGYNASTHFLNLSATPSNDLEIGGEFGPSHDGRQYGSGGSLGSVFSATLSVGDVAIDDLGMVTGGGLLKVSLDGSLAGSIGTDYSIANGNTMLEGTVREVLIGATGSNTLDVLFAITGGALQNSNSALAVNFAPANVGVLRIDGVSPPNGFSQSFALNGATIDLLGLNEVDQANSVGDFLIDGIVDARDYVVLRKSADLSTGLTHWRANFDVRTAGSGSATSSVPEPLMLPSVTVGFSILAYVRLRHTQ
jgi:hypothetical protein